MMQHNPFSLEDKTILVTGASSGIGRSIAVECSKMGAKIVLLGRNIERLEETLSKMSGRDHIIAQCDLTDYDAMSSVVKKLPYLDGVVHNAGMGDRTPCKMIKSEKMELVMKTNFEAPVMLQKALIREKKINHSASIVFISSRAPFAPVNGNAIYSASKGAINAYAKVLGLEMSPQKVRVNCVCPAMILTELAKKDFEITNADYHEDEKRYPLKRYGNPEDVAYLVIYLLSDASSWMTGSSIDITGGGEFTLKGS